MDAAEIARGLSGAWRLAKLDRDGMRAFGDTTTAFWRSFHAAYLAAPIYWLLLILRPEEAATGGSNDPVHDLIVQAITYVLGWFAYPLCVWYLAEALQRQDRYIRYICAYNWSVVLQWSAFLPVAALGAAEILSDGLSMVIALGVTGAVVSYQFFIVRTALDIEVLPALGFVALDLILSLGLQAIQDVMLAT